MPSEFPNSARGTANAGSIRPAKHRAHLPAALRRAFLATVLLALSGSRPALAVPRRSWPGFGRDAQHSARSFVTAQPLQAIRWSTPVDLAPQYSGNDLLIHYGSPLVSGRNTVVVTVKTGADDGFRIDARQGATGTLLWSLDTDYQLPPHSWTPSVGPTLARGTTLWVPAAGGTVLRRKRVDRAGGTVDRLAFYGVDHYMADPASFTTAVHIVTPITASAHGDVYFGFAADPGAPLGLQGGIARISSHGVGTWVSGAAASGDPGIEKVPYDSAPALSADGRTLYVAVNDAAAHGYLVMLDATTLATRAVVRLKDVQNPLADAVVADLGTASPAGGPDGDVYFGVLENPFGAHHARGWLLHFDATLAIAKLPGSFGWDLTPTIVPRTAVPSYTGTSPYLLLTKYNDYVEGGGDGVNRVAVVDPGAAMADSIAGVPVMADVMTIAGPTPDQEFRDLGHPLAVREWCIDTAAVDPVGRAAFVNNEDGILYRWDLSTNTLSEQVVLTAGIGEAYTPTIIGRDGLVYAINDATLFAVGTGP